MNRSGTRIQEIIEQIETLPNPAARALMQECMESVLSFYGQGLERILDIIQHAGIGAQRAYDDLLHDEHVRGLLLIHGLHPVSIEERLREALDKIRPYLESHGGNVELLGVENDFARLRLQGACKTCPSSAVTLELAVRHAIEEACPDLQGFDVEGAPEAPAPKPDHGAEWVQIEHTGEIADGSLAKVAAADQPLLVCRVAGMLYAYRDHCPTCNMPLHLGALEAGILSCGAGHRFHVQEAGRSLDDSTAHLDPLPLVVERGVVQVALFQAPHLEPDAIPT
jgi:Fe-S cluster biogenesis protein NfuA/nitrite reductase/ring-hydroxylating ferredoxin subunit